MNSVEFVKGLFRQFKAEMPKEEDQAQLLYADYVEIIEDEGFPEAVLSRAFRELLRSHESPWLPKIAECLRHCRKIRDEEAYRKQQTEEFAAEGCGIERLSMGIATTKAFTKKIHRACGKEAYRFIDVWKIVKAEHWHLPDEEIASGLLYAARLLCQGRAPREAARCAFPARRA